MNIEEVKKELDEIGFDNEVWKNALPSDISRRKVASALGVTDSNLISIEKGESLPSLLLAFKYCKMNNVSLEKLIAVKK